MAVERTCGDATSAVGAPLSCHHWIAAVVGSSAIADDVRRLAPGTYTIEVQAGIADSPEVEAVALDLAVEIAPTDADECASAAATATGDVHGDTAGHADAFAFGCSGTPLRAPEVVQSIDLATPRRVRLAVQGDGIAGSDFSYGLSLRLLDTCDPEADGVCVVRDSARTTCQATTVLERIVEAGAHTVVVESARDGSASYTLSYQDEAVGAACAGAPTLTGSGTWAGDTTGGVDSFRWNEAGCGAGIAPDVVLAMDLAAPSHVRLDLPTYFDGAFVQVVRACGEATVGGNGASRTLDLALDAGQYHVVIGGGSASEVGAFALAYVITPS
jgi:hypothetical protein